MPDEAEVFIDRGQGKASASTSLVVFGLDSRRVRRLFVPDAPLDPLGDEEAVLAPVDAVPPRLHLVDELGSLLGCESADSGAGSDAPLATAMQGRVGKVVVELVLLQVGETDGAKAREE